MPSVSRIRALTDGAALSLGVGGSGRYFLPQGGTLTGVTISISAAAQGPVLAHAEIAIHNDLADLFSLGSAKWVRGDTGFGFREAWTWDGEFDMSLSGEKDAILAVVRNDSGASVSIITSWTWRR